MDSSSDGKHGTSQQKLLVAKQKLSGIVGHVDGLGLSFPSTPWAGLQASQEDRARAKVKPNLRLEVAKGGECGGRPPPPPPKSPRYVLTNKAVVEKPPKTRRSHSPVSPVSFSSPASPAPSKSSLDEPVTPVKAGPFIAQTKSVTPVKHHKDDIKVLQSPVPTHRVRGRSNEEVTSPKRRQLSREMLEKPLPPIASPPLSKFNVLHDRPQTSDGKSLRAKSPQLGTWQAPLHSAALQSTAQLSQKPRTTLKSRLMLGFRNKSVQELNMQLENLAPSQDSVGIESQKWSSLSSRNTRPDVHCRLDEPFRPMLSRDETFATTSLRPATADGTPRQTARLRSSSDGVAEDPLARSRAALATARAKVAALQSSDAFLDSMSRSTDVDPGLLRGHNADLQPVQQQSTEVAQSDPITRLRELSKECEAVHAKYAALRTERTKLSSAIIASLNERQAEPEYAHRLLDEQHSLAAVNSSMDICFAKLKSLDCRKEEAIAALIAKTVQAEKSPADNISAMIASMAKSRKLSSASSIDSGRCMLSGRSTPDPKDAHITTRLSGSGAKALLVETDAFPRRSSSLSRMRTHSHDDMQSLYSAEQPGFEGMSSIEQRIAKRLSQIHERSDELPRSPARPPPDPPLQQVESVPGETNGSAWRPEHSQSDLLPKGLTINRPKTPTARDSKAAKVLGIQRKPVPDSPPTRAPAVIEPTAFDRERKDDLTIPSRRRSFDATSRSSIGTFATYVTAHEPDLDSQLLSFPKTPTTLSRAVSAEAMTRRDTSGSSLLTTGSSAESSVGEPEPRLPVAGAREAAKGQTAAGVEAERLPPRIVSNEEILEYYRGPPRQVSC